MNNTFIGFITNKYIYIPFILWFGIQLFKLIYDLVTTKKFNFKRIMGAGGMPSSHSAVVVSLATLIGKEYGVNSAIFAIAGKQAKVLNDIVNTPGLSNIQVQEKLQEALGHTPTQVFVGAIIGLVAGLIF